MREPYNDVCEDVVGVVEPREEGEIGDVGEEEQCAQQCPRYEEWVPWFPSTCES